MKYSGGVFVKKILAFITLLAFVSNLFVMFGCGGGAEEMPEPKGKPPEKEEVQGGQTPVKPEV